MADILTLRLFTNGGIVTPEELRKLTEVARLCSCDHIMPGSRQELYLLIEKDFLPVAERELKKNAIQYALVEEASQNIVTSFVALQILPTTAWLLGDTYLDILESFTYQPRLKINMADPLQNLVPLFTGELNFIASSYPRYWHLYINLSSYGKRQIWPVLIDGEDIAAVANLIEEVYFKQSPDTMQDLYLAVTHKFTGRTLQRAEELHFSAHQFPVIEGMHGYGSSYWLGIYRRNQSFPLHFLEALYRQCIEYKIGKICLTPHKTLIIKDIRDQDRPVWEKLMGMHQIHIQHSALELNWQIPDLDRETVQLKNTWAAELEQKEVYTSGLSFAIQTTPVEVATSVGIRQTREAGTAQAKYTVLHTHDFTTHSLHWQEFASHVSAEAVPAILTELCQVYYSQLGHNSPAVLSEEMPLFIQRHEVYQCPDCMTMYDPEHGDMAASIVAGTSFEELPETYTCSLCDTPKTSFILIEFGNTSVNHKYSKQA